MAVRTTLRMLVVLCLLVAAGHGHIVSKATAQGRSRGDLETVTAAQLHGLVDQYRGKVVVVNFWATWCPPCRAEFPDVIRVHDELHAQGLEVIAVSMNEADETEDIAEFLETYQPAFSVYRAASIDKAFYEGVTDNWFGELPITLVFDAAGRQIHYHRSAVTHDELTSDVTALLSQ